jgi:hypothetical protein
MNDIVISISAHGFNSGKNNYFYFNGSKIDKTVMKGWYRGFKGTKNRVITLIDTCHSENMVGFSKKGLSQKQTDGTFKPIVFSGCGLNQSLMEDISDEYGYGGGLTSAFLDATKGMDRFNLDNIAIKCETRVKKLGSHMKFNTASTITSNKSYLLHIFAYLCVSYFIYMCLNN